MTQKLKSWRNWKFWKKFGKLCKVGNQNRGVETSNGAAEEERRDRCCDDSIGNELPLSVVRQAREQELNIFA